MKLTAPTTLGHRIPTTLLLTKKLSKTKLKLPKNRALIILLVSNVINETINQSKINI